MQLVYHRQNAHALQVYFYNDVLMNSTFQNKVAAYDKR